MVMAKCTRIFCFLFYEKQRLLELFILNTKYTFMPSSNSNIFVKPRALIDIFLCTKFLGDLKKKDEKCSNYKVSILKDVFQKDFL